MLPCPAVVWQRRRVELWRDRLWQAHYKYMVLPGPQYRDLFRKLALSMDKAGLPGMAVQLQCALFCIWFFTGSVQKMEDLIVALINGRVFLLSAPLFLPGNIPPKLPKLELAKRLLLYDPVCHRDGYKIDAATLPTLFITWLGTPPANKPWIREWDSEEHEARRQAAAEIGKEIADALWEEVTGTKKPGNADRRSNRKSAAEKVSHW